MTVGRGEVDGAGIAGGDVAEGIERGHGHRAWRTRCAVARNADHEMGSGTSIHRLRIRSAVDAGADRVGRSDGLVAGGVEGLAEMADAIGQRHVGRQRGEAVGRGEVNGAGVAGGDIAEGIERGDGDRARRSRGAGGRKADREMGRDARRHCFGVRCAGDGVVDRVGRGDGLAARAVQGLAEAAGAVGQRHVGRQRGVAVGRGEVDRASVVGDDVVQGVERGHGDRARRPRCAVGRDAHGKVSGRAQCHVDREGLRAAQRAVARRRGDGIGVARRGGEIDLARIGDGDHARRGIDGEAAARTVAGQTVGYRIHVGRGRGDADKAAGRRAFRDLVGRRIAVDRRRRRDVRDGDDEALRARQHAVIGLDRDGVGVTGAGDEIDLGRVGDRYHAGVRIDLEAAIGAIAGQRIGDGIAGAAGGLCGEVDERVGCGALGDGDASRIGVDRCRQRGGHRRPGGAGRAAEIEILQAILRGECRCRGIQDDMSGRIEL